VISMGFCIAFRRDLNLQSRTSEIAGWGAGARRYPRTSLAFATVCPTVHYGESGCARTRGRLVLLDCKVLVISRTARDHPGNPAVVASPKWLRPTRLGPFSRPRPHPGLRRLLELFSNISCELRSPVTESNRRPSPYHACRIRPIVSRQVGSLEVRGNRSPGKSHCVRGHLAPLSLG